MKYAERGKERKSKKEIQRRWNCCKNESGLHRFGGHWVVINFQTGRWKTSNSKKKRKGF